MKEPPFAIAILRFFRYYNREIFDPKIALSRHLSSAVEQLFCKEWVPGSNPGGGSEFDSSLPAGRQVSGSIKNLNIFKTYSNL